jgi:hypothetical protein
MRTCADQTAEERSAAERFAFHDADVRTCPVLASSTDTLVWPRVNGKTLESIIVAARTSSSMRQHAVKTLTSVGVWLRTVHDANTTGVTTIDLGASIRALEASDDVASKHTRAWCDMALRILEAARRRLETDTATVTRSLTHGDMTPPNILRNPATGEVTIVDFEHARERAVSHDLVVMAGRLRAKRLDPRVSPELITQLEGAFWQGYGQVAREVRIAVSALASAWVFYDHLGRAAERARGRGLARRAMVALYQRVLASKQSAAAEHEMLREIEEL